MADSGVREIQLSGKQLVFLFMASVVLVVAVFLLGVSVGRGARGAAPSAEIADLRTPPQTEPPPVVPPVNAAAGDPRYHQELPAGTPGSTEAAAPKTTTSAPPATTTSALAPPPLVAPPPAAKPAPVTPPPATSPAKSESSTPSTTKTAANAKPQAAATTSWFVAAGSYRSKDSADSLVTKLKGKGYVAFIVDPTKPLYSVRVGPYPARADAEAAADKIKKDGVPTFVTR
jgi:cell division protein FtsN